MGLVSVAPLVLLCRRTAMRLVRRFDISQRERSGALEEDWTLLQGSLPVREQGRAVGSETTTSAQQHSHYHYCIYQITSLSASRRRCKISLPIGVDAESLTWDMGRGPPVARQSSGLEAAAVVIHGAVGLVPVEIELVSASRAAVFLLVAAERHPLAQRELPRTLSHISYSSPFGAGTARCPSTPCRAPISTYSTITSGLASRVP